MSEQLGGVPSLTAVFTILTGITGAVLGGAVLNLVRVRDHRARGLAIGVVAHGIGTAREMPVHPTSGAFAGLGMALNGVTTAALGPTALHRGGTARPTDAIGHVQDVVGRDQLTHPNRA